MTDWLFLLAFTLLGFLVFWGGLAFSRHRRRGKKGTPPRDCSQDHHSHEGCGDHCRCRPPR